jgi:hypothetical protein
MGQRSQSTVPRSTAVATLPATDVPPRPATSAAREADQASSCCPITGTQPGAAPNFEVVCELTGDPEVHSRVLLNHHRSLLWRAVRTPQPVPADRAPLRVDVDEPVERRPGELTLRVVGSTELVPAAPRLDLASLEVAVPLRWRWAGSCAHAAVYEVELRLQPRPDGSRLVLAGRLSYEETERDRIGGPGVVTDVVRRRARELVRALAQALDDVAAIHAAHHPRGDDP